MAGATQSPQRDQLVDERDRLRAKLGELGLGENGSLSFDGGFADSSQVTAERSEIEALAGSLAETLRDVEDALTKMDDGTYGRCQSCSGEIGDARLEAMPAARLCISCASKTR
ncbi:MAG: TraR/DksA family transcriptional regulator [Actinobacteria bacterium]|nr:TraR/DksA family transcriptional regulator [Actinomycetota bacterium]